MNESDSIVTPRPASADPSIEKLLPYTQSAHMQQIFQSRSVTFFGERCRVLHCKVFYSRYKSFHNAASWVKSSISVGYRLTLQTESKEDRIIILFTQSFLEDRSVAKWEELSALPPNIRPTLHLPELGMILWRHPSDPLIASLPRVLSPARVGHYLPLEHLPGMAGIKPDELIVTPEVVKYSPGKCCTTRYRIKVGESATDREIQVYGKTYSDARGHDIYNRWCHFQAQSDSDKQCFGIAQPLSYCDSVSTVWQAAIDGTRLESVLDRSNYRVYVQKIATGIASVHASDFNVSRRVDVTELCLDLGKKISKLNRSVPACRTVLEPLITWGKENQPTGRESPERLLHGDFHADQILVTNNKLYLFDLDSMAWGDPELDWAEFTVDLVMREWDADLVFDIVEHALDRYQRGAGCSLCMKRLRWYAMVEFITRLHHHYRALRSDWSESISKTLLLLPVVERVLDQLEGRWRDSCDQLAASHTPLVCAD